MALIKCKKCGQSVSDKAMKCPKCGCTLKTDWDCFSIVLFSIIVIVVICTIIGLFM